MKMNYNILLIIILLVIGPVYTSSAMQDVHSIEAFVAEEVIIAGDYTMVGIYARKGNNPSDVKVAYLELFNEAGEAVVQEMGYLDKGIGNIPLPVPENTPSGYYLFRTYTSDAEWDMRSSYYQAWIAIINPDDPPIINTEATAKNTPFQSKAIIGLEKNTYTKKEMVKLGILSSIHGVSFLSVKQVLPGIGIPKEVVLENQTLEKARFRQFREIHGHIIKVTNVLPGDQIFLSSMGKYKEMYFAEPEEDGTAYIFMDSKRSFDDLILQSSLQSGPSGMEIESPFWEARPKVKDWPKLELPEETIGIVQQKALNREVKKHFHLPDTMYLSKPAPLIDAYHVYNLDDFNRFETLGETFKEYIPQVVLRNRRGRTEFRLRNVGGITKENPLVLLDGVPVFDIDGLSKWPAADIRRIEINNRYMKLGSKDIQGIINIESFNGDMAKFPLGDRALVLDYPRPMPAISLNHPDYTEDKPTRKPDFRSLLFWGINRDAISAVDQVIFSTADSAGDYMAVLRYLSDKGVWQEDYTLFSVRD